MADDPHDPSPPDNDAVKTPDPAHPNIRPFTPLKGGHADFPSKPPGKKPNPFDLLGMPADTKLPLKLEASERRLRIFQLHREGVTFLELGRLFGVSAQRCATEYHKIASRLIVEDVESKRQLLWDRLEIATTAVLRRVRTGDPKAVEALVRVTERQAKLYGLDAPLKVAATTPDGDKWAPWAVAIQSLTDDELRVMNKLKGAALLAAALSPATEQGG